MALVETAGVERWCNALIWPELGPGDKVVLHAGLVVRVPHRRPRRARPRLAFAQLGGTPN